MPLYAGFDLGGTDLKYGLIDDIGRILFKARTESPAKIEELIHLLKRIWQNLKKREEITAEEVFQRAKKGDKAAFQAFSIAGFYLGVGLSIAINLLNPDKILLGVRLWKRVIFCFLVPSKKP